MLVLLTGKRGRMQPTFGKCFCVLTFCQITITGFKYLLKKWFMSFSGLFEWVSSDVLEQLPNYVVVLIVCLWEMKIKPATELFKFGGSGNTSMEGLSRVLVIYLGFCATSMHFNELILLSSGRRVRANQRPNVYLMILQHTAIKWDSGYIPRFWKGSNWNSGKIQWTL